MVNGTDRNSEKTHHLILGLGVLTTSIALAIYGTLGTFSRYGSDDYCLSAFFHQPGNFIDLMIQRYQISTGRYTNTLFIGLVDKLFGWYNVAILPPLMLALFVLGSYLLLKEIVRLASLGWSRLLTLLLAGLLVYFSVTQAPNLYETLYWRAGMTSHFAPLVFLTFLGAFVVRAARLATARPVSVWTLVICFLGALLLGGFSEPPLTTMITVLVLGLLAVWWWDDSAARRPRLLILFWTLAGALLSLAILALAPANSLRLGTPPPGMLELIARSFKYPYEFISDVFRSLPLSTLITFLLPAVIFSVAYSRTDRAVATQSPKQIVLILIAVVLVSYLLIAASFAPSVYGQSFPVPRARFTGQVLLTCALMVNGALIGVLLAGIKTKQPIPTWLYRFAIISLMLLTLYPIRTASRMAMEIPVYRQRAQAWDARDANIRALQAAGERNLVIPFLEGEVIQDLGDHKGFRLNRCAATLYGVDTILARPMDED